MLEWERENICSALSATHPLCKEKTKTKLISWISLAEVMTAGWGGEKKEKKKNKVFFSKGLRVEILHVYLTELFVWTLWVLYVYCFLQNKTVTKNKKGVPDAVTRQYKKKNCINLQTVTMPCAHGASVAAARSFIIYELIYWSHSNLRTSTSELCVCVCV